MQKVIYIAEDDENIRNLIKSFLKDTGYEVKDFENGDLLYSTFLETKCDLIILDVMMPGTDGITICSKLRDISNVPIIVLTARDSEMDYVKGISMGSDDYLIKPFRPTILMMKVKALLRRVEMERAAIEAIDAHENNIEYGDLKYSNYEKIIYCYDKNLELTLTELYLLSYLIKNASKAISRDDLLSEVWGIDTEVETRVTDETIRRIRKKMLVAGSNVQIQTVWGFGYKLILRKEDA
ncbi:DNA-binding response regulator [Clostridium gelidum]|uniref:Stage 0 sporulation protein A homolog n=1 Tax=Clostridium gelidum TaxID=704125 RepID=A0ABN6J0R7_9CLOT|nr:response regulator transcription factor [Clostridium gelidum]BCZ47313.1 DNA-binding response regulator [Clostridium gelidum]